MTIKRGDLVKFKGLVGRVTFIDHATKYVRLEHNSFWKTQGFLKDVSAPTAQEIAEYEAGKQ